MDLLIDGNNMAYRDFYGGGAGCAASNAMRRVDAIVSRFGFERVLIAWDRDDCFRKELYPDYKAGRNKPEGIDDVLDDVRHAMDRCGYTSLDAPGYEADDIIGTWCCRGILEDRKSVVYSSDKDLHQLIAKDIISQLLEYKLNFGSPESKWRTYDGNDGLIKKYGVRAEQWVDYRCLIGDTSDNIAGFAGVGPVKAQKILGGWETIDDYYADPERHKIPPSLRKSMEEGRNKLELLRDLMQLRHSEKAFNAGVSEPAPF